MWLVGCTYNFCWPHHELSRRAARAQGCKGEVLLTPAMASGLTDHVWSVRELLTVRVPPSAWVAPRRRGRPEGKAKPGTQPGLAQSRPVLRLRKGGLMSLHQIGESYRSYPDGCCSHYENAAATPSAVSFPFCPVMLFVVVLRTIQRAGHCFHCGKL